MLAATAVLHLKQALCSYVNFTGTGIQTGSLALAQLLFQEIESHLYWNTVLAHRKVAMFSDAFVSTLLRQKHILFQRDW